MNLFGTVLTYSAPSANYRGESAENRAVIQKVTFGRFEYAIISPEAIRNALRETLARLGKTGEPKFECNRKRLDDEKQLAVEFTAYPSPEQYIDDFFMGWLIAAKEADQNKIRDELREQNRSDAENFKFKRDSILRMNMAVALEPYRYDSVFTQSPWVKAPEELRNAKNSQLLHRETTYTAFQYPFALNLEDCSTKPVWTKALLEAIGQLNEVAGNHARSYFEMAPASIILRLTNQLVAGYDNYGFKIEEGKHLFSEVIDGIEKGDYPGSEFYIGGKIVKDMDEQKMTALKGKEVTLERSPQTLLKLVGKNCFSSKADTSNSHATGSPK